MLTRRFFLTGTSMAFGAAIVPSLFVGSAYASPNKPIVLTAREGLVPLSKTPENAASTKIWGYNGGVPGPTLRCKAGERIKVRLVNELKQATSIHWHGIRIQNDMDGVPGLTQEEVKPGESFDYDFIAPDAGTYWYHTHSRSWEQMARGLYGLLIIDEIDLPQAFDRDIALAIDDWQLKKNNQINESTFGNLHDWAHGGRMGNWLTVNGASNPDIALVSGERVRLRLANTCNARILSFGFERHAPQVIALDGRPIKPRALTKNKIILAPGQRADLAFIANGQPGSKLALQETTYRKPYTFAHFAYASGTKKTKSDTQTAFALPLGTRKLDLIGAEAHDLVMTGGAMGTIGPARYKGRMMSRQELIDHKKIWAFNGRIYDFEEPLLTVKIGKTIIINMVNDTMWPHAIHTHGHHFRVIKRAGRPVEEDALRDTVLIKRREKLSIAFVADNPGKWLLHCHMLEHVPSGMMTWFNVEA